MTWDETTTNKEKRSWHDWKDEYEEAKFHPAESPYSRYSNWPIRSRTRHASVQPVPLYLDTLSPSQDNHLKTSPHIIQSVSTLFRYGVLPHAEKMKAMIDRW